MKNEVNNIISNKILELAPVFYSLSDYIFDNPELGYQEHKACRALCKTLTDFGFSVEESVGGLETSFRAVYSHGEGGPSIGLLCEYDALPDLGHACGHHMQGPAIILCAQTLKEIITDTPFKIVVYGTPAEELLSAKYQMWENGCFRDIDVALMMHASTSTAVDSKSLAATEFVVTYHGESAHAAMFPERGKSAFDALLLAFHGTEMLREHVRDDVRLHYTCLDAGGPANIVPSTAKGQFLLRSLSTSYLKDLIPRFLEIIRGASIMAGVTYSIEDSIVLPNKIPVPLLNEVIMKNARLADAPGISPPRDRPGSTDFSAVMYNIPGACLRIKFVDPPVVSHSPAFAAHGKTDEAHRAISQSAEILAYTCADILYDVNLLNQVKEEFAENKNKYS